MADEKHIIEPQRLGLWVAVAFVIALLALAMSIISMKRTSDQMIVTQAEILLLNKRIQALQKDVAPAPVPAPAAAAPAADASQPAP